MHDVLIAGAGPTGMMLAGELALAGIDVAMVERRPTAALAGSRAGGLHARTIEVFDQRGLAGRFLAEGKPAQVAAFAGTPLDLSDFPTRHPYGLALWQNHIERILAGWIAELPVTIYRDREITGFTQDATGVDVGDLRARYLVGCDGGRSIIRKTAGIEFAGSAATTSALIAEVELAAEPPWGMRRDETGTHGFSKLEGSTVRVMVTERTVRGGDADLGTLSEALIAVFGSDFGVHSPTWISRFTDMARQAVRYRDRRVLLAGDAAHVHSPVGGQGLNLGVQDAVNLGWKLARVLRGTSDDDLLDSYHRERHPVAARVLRHTLAQVALHRVDDRTRALTEVLGELMRMDEPRKRFAGMMSGLDVHYDLGAGHPLLGRRMPDLELVTQDGPVRVFTLLHAAHPVLLDLGAGLAPPAIRATCAGPWELPVIGAVPAPHAVLIRPDGHVAWVDDGPLPAWFTRHAGC